MDDQRRDREDLINELVQLRQRNADLETCLSQKTDELRHLESELKQSREKGITRDITERTWAAAEGAKAETALAKSEKKYRELVKYSPAAIYEVNVRTMRFLSVNDAMCYWSGYSREEFLAMNPLDVLDDESKIIFQARIAQWLKGEKPNDNVDYKVITKDGQEFYIDLHVTFSRDESGNPMGATVIGHNVTERKRAEEALRVSEEKYRTIVQTAREGIWVIDGNDQTILVNEKLQQMLGYSFDELAGRSPQEFMASEFQAAAKERLLEHMEGTRHTVDYRFIKKDGSEMWCILSSTPLFDINGKFDGSIAMITDITDRKHMEEALRESDKRQAFLLKLNDALRPLSDALEIQRTAMGIVGEHLQVDRVMYNEITHDGQTIHIEDNYVRNGFPKVTGDFLVSSFGKAMDVLRRGEVLVIEDQTATTLKEPSEREASTSLQIYASATIPLIKNDRWVANFGVLQGSPRKWTEHEIAILQEIAERTWAAVERSKAEEELQDYRRHLEELVQERTREVEEEVRQRLDLLESISDCFYSLDRDLRFTYVNTGAEKAWGLSRADLKGKKIEDVFPGSIDTSLGKFRQVLRDKKFQHYELYSNVVQSWVYMSVYPNQEGISVFWHDLTELKNTQFELKQSQQDTADALEFNRAILEGSPLGISTYDSSGQCKYANNSAARIAGGSVEQFDRNIYNVEPWQKHDGMLIAVRRAMETGIEELLEVDFTSIFGTKFWLHCRLSRFTSGGEPHLLLTYEDITERKNAEEALRQSEERFAQIFMNSPVPIAIIRMQDDRFIDVNQKLLDLTGYSREEVLGSTPVQLNLGVQDPLNRESLLAELREKGEVQSYEYKIKNRSGKILTVLSSFILTNLDNELCRIVTTRDVTKEKEMEAEMARLDRLNLIGEMAASIGHEIRNPMTSVRGFLQMLGSKQEYQDDSPFFELMIEELDRANAIITEYLSMAKDKRVELQPRPLNSIIGTMWPVIQSDANLREIKLEFELSDIPHPCIDESEIRQLILNMARNGMEAMSMGGKLTIGTRQEDNQVVLYLQDEGHGLNPELMERLGTPFLTTKDNGTGLGLAVCYSIAARHNAKIDFETGPSGTTFYVRFPVPEPGDAEAAC